jgi:hypothetical protein
MAVMALSTMFCLAGCGEIKKATEVERKPVTLPGHVPVDVATGNVPPASAPPGAVPAAPNAAPGVPATVPPPAPPMPDLTNKQGIIGKTTARVVDKAKATAENPSLVELQNSLQGGDPISIATSAYFTVRGKASTLGLQNELNQFKGINERNPTHDELLAMMKTHGITFTELPPYQMYAYDSATGKLSILEDKDEKARRYKAAGLPVE